jgi:hypothetical protein
MGESSRGWGARLAARPHLSAALLLGLLVLAYLWPALVGGRILSPIADLYGVVPWQGLAPSDVHDYVNPNLADLPLVDYPWRFLARELIRSGTFPAWDPYVLSGAPFFSNPQTGLFSAFNLPLWILPLTYALGLSAALKLLAGAFGAYLLARELALGFLAGLLAGIAFAFSSINIVWLTHDTLPAVIVLLPWALWLVERILARGRLASALGLAVVTAIALGGGHPGMQVHLILVVAIYTLVRAPLAGAWRLRPLLLVVGGLAAGALAMAFMLVPEARSSHDTVGVLARREGALPGAHMPFAALRTVLFPDWWGRPSAIEGVGDPARNPVATINYNERTFYAGVVALLLACVGLLARGGWRRKAPFALLGVLGLAIPLGAPGLHWLATHLPVLESVSAHRLHFAFELAVALLAGFGLQALLDAPRGERRRLLVPLAALLAGIVALAGAGAGAGDAGRVASHFLTGEDYASSSVLALTSVVWFLLFALGASAALLLARALPRRRVAIAAALVLLAAADAYHFAHGYQPMGPQSKVIPPVTPAIAYPERHRADGRIVGLRSALPNDWALVYGIGDVRGYDPPQPTRRMLALWRIANPEQVGWESFVLEDLGPQAVRVLGVLGARYIVAEPGSVLPRSATSTGISTVYAQRDATIFANARVTPRALVPTRALVTPDEGGTRAAIVEARFDPRTTVAVERDQPGVAGLARAAGGGGARLSLPPVRGSAAIVRERNASVTLRAQLDRRGLVVLDDDFTDGWSVRVDGRPAPALHVDDVMRGVIVPAGRHEVVWSYAVPGLRLGALVSLLTLAALAGGGIALARSARLRARARG